MATEARPKLIDKAVLKAQSHPIRANILNILSEGPNSPARMHERIEGVSLSLLCHHIKVLRNVGLIELVEVRREGGWRVSHQYRALKRQFFDLEEWLEVDPKFRDPIVATILREISQDAGRSAAEGRFNEIPDRHLSRAPAEVDREGWKEIVDALAEALDKVLEAHARSAERAQKSGEELIAARVAIMQFPIGRPDRSS
jgi:DNA-binding transcriptional ArsR family regulator